MDETTILDFRHLLEQHVLTEAMFAEVNAHLAERGVTLRSGTRPKTKIRSKPLSRSVVQMFPKWVSFACRFTV